MMPSVTDRQSEERLHLLNHPLQCTNDIDTNDVVEAEKNSTRMRTEIHIRPVDSGSLENSALNVPELLKMVTEPLNEYCKESKAPAASVRSLAPQVSTKPAPPPPPPQQKLGISRSQDDDYNEREEEFSERRFGSISPIYQTSRPGNSIISQSVAKASNLRLKFRKSHTCGSLFAKCNCGSISPPTITTTMPLAHKRFAQNSHYMPIEYNMHNTVPVVAPTTTSNSTNTTSPYYLSHNNSFSSVSSSNAKYTSGFYSLSAQTSSATSAQLSRDDSINASYDLSPASHGAAVAEAVSGSLNESVYNDESFSQIATKQVNTSETETLDSAHAKLRKTFPRISSTDSAAELNSAATSAAASPAATRKGDRKTKRFFQSYSHPDTDFIFTEENKNPSRESLVQIHVQHQQESPVIKSRGGKVEIKHSKRSSSPNIGSYQILDVAVHPDIVVKVSPKHSPLSEPRRVNSPLSLRSTQQRRRLFQRSHEIDSGSSTSESEYSFDLRSGTDLKKLSTNSASVEVVQPPKSPTAQNRNVTNAQSAEDRSFNAAQKYFVESGILGPINTTSNLIRKTSKILQDSNVIEQIRKTSMTLRANSAAAIANNINNRRVSIVNSPTTTTTTISTKTNTTSCSTSTIPQAAGSHPSIFIDFQNDVEVETTPDRIMYSSSSSSSKQLPPHAMATACGFSPNVTTQGCACSNDKDAQLKNLQGEIFSLNDVIKSRDAEIVKLRREIHKLKSVLQQTTNHLPIVKDDLLKSPTLITSNRRCLSQQSLAYNATHEQLQQQHKLCAACKKNIELDGIPRSSPSSNGSIGSGTNDNYESCSSLSLTTHHHLSGVGGGDHLKMFEHTEIGIDAAANASNIGATATAIDPLACNSQVKVKMLQAPQGPVLKKQGVSGESCETSMQQSINMPIPKYDKDFSSKQLIKDAIMDNDFLKNIDASQVRELVESMYSLSVAKGEFVIREGEVGAHLYVSAEGEFEVVKDGKILGIMGPGKAFGELAILYNCTRTASIRVLSDARVWVLDRRVFQQIMMRTGMQRIENSVNFLKSVPLLKNLSEEVLAKIADVLEVEFYPAGTYIIRQGASGDTFFLISQGSVKVTQKLSPSTEEKEIRTLDRGDYFGEQALINEDKRTANIIAMAPGVECLTLDRESFTHLIGDLCELKEKNYGDENRVLAMKFAEKTKKVFGADVKQEFPNMKLTDLEVVGTLGIGGFGRVELVKAYQENRVDIFALKCLKKRHIVDTKQEEHVFSERTIMLTCNSPFICRLYRTFRDEKYVYMLLEACMGGEIWTMLRDRGSFSENATQFIIGCVLQAFEYLHSHGIIYRDLKPENLMLDERGYVKLVDFGFAKHIGNGSKTWTFCGTPEYVAPEIILNKGHDRAVDYWALGILIHELLNGTPPFTATDPMKTYNIILKGIDMIDFPKHMSRSAIMLIKKLCRDVPAERLGYQKGGIQDIKKHKWFLGFDWDGLENQLLIPPFVRPIAHPTDTTYFDKFPCDQNEPPDENSGWDADF